MTKITLIVLLFAAIVILSIIPESFAHPQYLNSYDEVYGNVSCGTCHVINSGGGQRDL